MPSSTKILAVDDNQIQSYAIERKLHSAGFHVTTLYNGTDALAAANTGTYQAVLLDVDMPDMSGFEVCAQVRANPSIPQPAIIFHSATNATEFCFRKAIELGGDAFLTYPIETEALSAVILHYVAVRQGSPTTGMLTCWKDIARFFGKGVRTVQRWELNKGLPVRRAIDGSNVILADPQELRRWVQQHFELRGRGTEGQSGHSSAAS